MKIKCGLFLTLCFCTGLLLAANPEGLWTTIDDKTLQKRALVRISMKKNELYATIERIYPAPGDTGICANCPGELKNKPIQGMEFAWGLKRLDKNTWGEGHILDPKTGKIYRAKMTLEGDRLYVRGYIGMPVLGRTQVWRRSV